MFDAGRFFYSHGFPNTIFEAFIPELIISLMEELIAHPSDFSNNVSYDE